MTSIDRQLRLCLTGEGPIYVNADAVGVDIPARRVRNMLYKRYFANRLLQEVLLCRGKLNEALGRLQLSFGIGGNWLGGLCPSQGKTTWAIVEESLRLPAVDKFHRGLVTDLFEMRESESISIDVTVRICFPS